MKPKPGDWNYIRPWYVRMWDGPVIGVLMYRVMREAGKHTVAHSAETACRYFVKYL